MVMLVWRWNLHLQPNALAPLLHLNVERELVAAACIGACSGPSSGLCPSIPMTPASASACESTTPALGARIWATAELLERSLAHSLQRSRCF